MSLDAVITAEHADTQSIPESQEGEKNKMKIKLHFTIKLSLEDCRMIL